MTAMLRLDPTRALVRGVRAGVLTVPAVGMAASAHASAGSCTSLVGLGLAAGVSWPAAVALLGRRRSVLSLLAWLTLVQAVTHVILEQLCPDVMSGQMGLLDHLLMGLTPTMLLMHGGSVLLTALVLARADAGLWTARALIRAGARMIRTIRLPKAPAVVVPRTRLLPVEPKPLIDLWKAPHPVRRGPPALLHAR